MHRAISNLLTIIFLILAVGNTGTAAAEFDGLPWGTANSAVEGQVRSEMRGKVTAIRRPLDKLDDHYDLYSAYKIYYFCEDKGLCGGKLNLLFRKGEQATHIEHVLRRLQSILAETYGHRAEDGRISTLRWSLSDLEISVRTGVESDFPEIEILYQAPQYFQTQAHAEREVFADIRAEASTWDFKF